MKFLKNNNAVKFTVTLFLVGFLIGVFFNVSFKIDTKDYLNDFTNNFLNNHINTFLLSIIIVSCIFILSLSIIGMPIILLYLFYEGFSIGFTLVAFTINYGIKGTLFYILYFLIIKVIFIICILYLILMSVRFDYRITKSLINKKREEVYKIFTNQLYRYILVLIVVIINTTGIYFFADKIIKLFLPLIK